MSISKSTSNIKLIECNQLASNYPIEDRLRVTRFHDPKNDSGVSDTIALAVFDGHGGGPCADLVSRRLFHYIALSLNANPESYDRNCLNTMIEDLFYSPVPYHNITSLYDDKAADYLINYLIEHELKLFEKFVKEMTPTDDISTALENAFLKCDNDLSEEIETNLLTSTSNVLLHHYLSLAVSGCCVTLMLIHKDIAYIASTGTSISS